MKLKKKPTKPVRKTIGMSESLAVFSDVAQLIDWVQEMGLNPADLKIGYQYSYDESLYMTWKEDEDQNIFHSRMEEYYKDMGEYRKWYEDNAEAVDAELDRRDRKDKLKRQKRELAKKSREELQEQIMALNEELSKI